jgi:ApaG protein
MSVATTRGVRVEVAAQWLPERSNPAKNQWFFTYRVRLVNMGEETVQLVSRHWLIENGHGRIEEVRGPGVVGETPILDPGQSFTYQSFCPLDTPIGSMRGTYQMRVIGRDGDTFDAEIAPFTLACPSALN